MILCVTTPAPRPAESLSALARLGFEPVDGSAGLLSDGAAALAMDGAPAGRLGLRVWRSALAEGAEPWIERQGPVAFEGGRLLQAPSGARVEVLDGDPPALELSDRGRVLGGFAGVSLESPSLARSLEFWGALLGASLSAGGAEQGWVTARVEGGPDLSFMAPFACPHSFVNPSLTYFNGGRNAEVIADLERRGAPVFEVVGGDDPAENVILREPGGVGFFVFND